MILKGSTSSRFGNVPPYPSVVRDKGLAEMDKKVCVVNAADYSYFKSVRGDSVAQTLVGYKNLKTSLPNDVFVGKAFHGEFRYNIPRNIRQPSPQHPDTISCLGVGACLKVNARALGRGALHKKGDSIPLLLTSEEIGAEPVEGPSLDQ